MPTKRSHRNRFQERVKFMRKILFTLITLMLTLGVFVPGVMAFSKDSLTWQKCTGCHEPKEGKISRVEELRTTPEEWVVIVDRMARLHGMDLDPSEMNPLIKELSSTQGLTFEEAEKVKYLDLYNNPQNVETPQPGEPEKLFVTCVRCHSAGKIRSYRMTESAWAKIRDLHLYMVPTVIGQMREMKWIPEADAVLAQLAKSQPYDKALSASKDSPTGSWLILGYEPGKGNYRGEATIKNAANGDYEVAGSWQYADGHSESFFGDASLYGGSAFRINTQHNGSETLGAFSFADGILRGQYSFPAPDFRTSTSAWYPLNGKAQVIKMSPGYLVSGEPTTLMLEGIKLPQVTVADVHVSGGALKVVSAKQQGANAIELQVIYRGKGALQTKLSVKGINAGTLNLVTKVDYIAITPELGRARVDGGQNFPAEGVQFDVIAYSQGANADNSDDDITLGPVAAKFSLTELVTRPEDDDLVWLGGIGAEGTYLPSSDYGPIEVRDFHAEATGLVKVLAEYKRGERIYKAEARLVVTEPDYIPRIK
jgi:quinohemoprotein amine dehydrogenase